MSKVETPEEWAKRVKSEIEAEKIKHTPPASNSKEEAALRLARELGQERAQWKRKLSETIDKRYLR